MKEVIKMTALEIIKGLLEEHSWLGIRCPQNNQANKKWRKNQIIAKSHRWQDGDCTSEILNGTCAIMLDSYWTDAQLEKALNIIKTSYHGNRYILITGDSFKNGEDQLEVIVENARYLMDITL